MLISIDAKTNTMPEACCTVIDSFKIINPISIVMTGSKVDIIDALTLPMCLIATKKNEIAISVEKIASVRIGNH